MCIPQQRTKSVENKQDMPGQERVDHLRQFIDGVNESDFALRENADWKATEYDCAMMRLDDLGVPTELYDGGDKISIVGRINLLWRRAVKAESDLETINLRNSIQL